MGLSLIGGIYGDQPWQPPASSRVEFLTMEDGPNMKPEYRVFITGGPIGGIPVNTKVWDDCFVYEWWPDCKGDES